MAIQKLTSNDTNAPTLNGQDGSLADVLKWALPQLGWSVHWEHAGGMDVVFQNSSSEGTGHMVRFIDSDMKGQGHDGYFYDDVDGAVGAKYEDQRFCEVRVYKTFDGPEQGEFTGECPHFQTEYTNLASQQQYFWFGENNATNLAANTNGAQLITKSELETVDSRPWEIIGDEQTFHLFTYSGNAKHWSYFGDMVSIVPNKSHIFVALCGNSHNPTDTRQTYPFRQVYPESPTFLYSSTDSRNAVGIYGLNCGISTEANQSIYESVFIPSIPFGESYGMTLGEFGDPLVSNSLMTSVINVSNGSNETYSEYGAHPGIGRAFRQLSYTNDFQFSRVWMRGNRNPAINIGWLRGVWGGVGSWDQLTFDQQVLSPIPTHLGDKDLTVYHTSAVFNEPFGQIGKNSLWIDLSSTDWE